MRQRNHHHMDQEILLNFYSRKSRESTHRHQFEEEELSPILFELLSKAFSGRTFFASGQAANKGPVGYLRTVIGVWDTPCATVRPNMPVRQLVYPLNEYCMIISVHKDQCTV